jgi:hypothetical protein
MIEKKIIETEIYKIGNTGFSVEVAPDINDDNHLEFYLAHESVGVKNLMNGCLKDEMAKEGLTVEDMIVNEELFYDIEEYFNDYIKENLSPKIDSEEEFNKINEELNDLIYGKDIYRDADNEER